MLRSSRSLALAAAALWMPAAATSQASDPGAAVDAYLAPLLKLNDFAGVVLIAAGDEVVVRRAYGWADRADSVRNGFEQRFQIGSISKQFTAAAVLVLADEGRLSVEDPLSRHLPEFPGGDSIRVHQLLTHTSGLGDLFAAPSFRRLRDAGGTLEELAGVVAAEVPRRPPGSGFLYSNAGYAVLARLVERVSGVPFAAFLRERLLLPLGMPDSGLRVEAALAPDQATPYDPLGHTDLEPAKQMHPRATAGAGSMVSTADDLLRWMRALAGARASESVGGEPTGGTRRGGEGPLSTDALVALTTDHGNGYGYGVTVGRTRIGHDGRTAGVSAVADWYRDTDHTVIFLANLQTGAMVQIRDALAEIARRRQPSPLKLRGDVDAPRLTADPGWLDAGLRGALVGRYRFAPTLVVALEERDGRLLARANDGFATELVPMEDGVLFSRALFANIRFERGADGTVERLLWLTGGSPWTGEREP